MLGGTLSAWAIAMIVTALVNLKAHPEDIGRATGVALMISLYVGFFAWIGWVVFVLPVAAIRGGANWLHHPTLGEFIWVTLALVSFAVLVGSWLGPQVLEAAWIPGSIGLLAGLWHRWLWSRKRKNLHSLRS